MARSERTADELLIIAADLELAAQRVRSAVKLMQESEMPSALLHGAAQVHTYMPFVFDWAKKVDADVESQVRAFKAGRESRSHAIKRYNDGMKKKRK